MADIQPASPVPLSPESGLLHAQLRTLHAVAEAETYQQIVDSVFHGLSLLEIANCSLWLFGPSEHERAHGPFGYAERVGLRTRVFRPGTEVIRRLPIRFHTPFYERLQSGEPLTAMTAADLDTSNNPIMRTLLKSMPLTDWVICPLNTSTREFGLVFVGVDSDHALTDEALESLYSVCAQVAVKTALLVLQNEQSSSHHERTALLHTVRDGVLLTQTGSEGASVLAVNERFQRLFNCAVLKPGMQLDVLLNRMQVPPSVRHTLMASWREMSVKEREIQNGSFEMTTVSGQPVEIVWYSAPMINPDSDRVFSRLFIFHDATPERAAVQVRSAFLSRVSHELRTPLTSISGFTQFILQETDDDLPELAREYLIIINESAGKLKEIFKELIEITRAYAGEIRLDLHDVNMEQTVLSTVRQFEAAAEEQNLTISVDTIGDVPWVQADGVKIGRVINSLISNAVKFAPRGGSVQVEISLADNPADLPAHAPTDVMTPAVVVQVIDDGAGVPETDAEAIFEPFHRAKNASAKQVEGAGLGLAVSRSLIDLHRGDIWAQPVSKKSTGGRFVFTLPLSTTL